MRILRLYYLLPPIKGGMEKHIYHLSKFQSKNNDVSIFFNQGNAITSNDRKIFPLIKFYKIRPLFIGVFLFYAFVVFSLIFDRKKVDVIHIHGDWSSLIFINLLKILTKAKIIVFTCHGTITNNFTHQKLLPRYIKKVDLIFTTGYEAASMIQKMVHSKVVVQPSGISDVFFQDSNPKVEDGVFKVVTVANLVAVKNIKLVLEIANNLTNIEFTIVGDGPEREMLEEIVALNKLSNVRLLGFKSPEEVKEIYDQSDCFLLTSLAEGTPTSALEAMTSGLPIVVSNAGGINNIIIDRVNGFVINNYEKENYISKLELLKNDLELRTIINVNNKAISKNFTWDKVAYKITNLTNECLNEKN